MWLFMPIDRMIYIHLVYVYVFSIIRTGVREKWIVEGYLSFSGFQSSQSLGDGWMDGWTLRGLLLLLLLLLLCIPDLT